MAEVSSVADLQEVSVPPVDTTVAGVTDTPTKSTPSKAKKAPSAGPKPKGSKTDGTPKSGGKTAGTRSRKSGGGGGGGGKDGNGVSLWGPMTLPTFDESTVPRSTVRNLARPVLPTDGTGTITRDALMALTKGTSVFISYIAALAQEACAAKRRKTVLPQDVWEALEKAEMSQFVEDLKADHDEAEQRKIEKRELGKRKSQGLELELQDPDEGDEEGDGAGARKKRKKAEGEDDEEEEDEIVDDEDEDADAGGQSSDSDGDEEDAEEEEEDITALDRTALTGQDPDLVDDMEDEPGRGGIVDEALDDDDSD
ncbi:hypothetical protein PYCC9005_004655 [Savitreella phatthalungensis]